MWLRRPAVLALHHSVITELRMRDPSPRDVWMDWPDNVRKTKNSPVKLDYQPFLLRVDKALEAWGYSEWEEFVKRIQNNDLPD